MTVLNEISPDYCKQLTLMRRRVNLPPSIQVFLHTNAFLLQNIAGFHRATDQIRIGFMQIDLHSAILLAILSRFGISLV